MLTGWVDGVCSASAGVVVVMGGSVSARDGARGALASLPMAWLLMLLAVLLFESCLAELAVVVVLAVVLERCRPCLALEWELGLLACSAVAAPLFPAREACDSFRSGVPGEAPPPPGGRDSALPIAEMAEIRSDPMLPPASTPT